MTRSTAVVNEITLVRSAVFKEALENKPGESDSKPNRLRTLILKSRSRPSGRPACYQNVVSAIYTFFFFLIQLTYLSSHRRFLYNEKMLNHYL